MHFNVFDAAPENERDGPTQQQTQNATGKVLTLAPIYCLAETNRPQHVGTRIFPIDYPHE